MEAVIAMVPDRHVGSGSGSKLNRCQIGGLSRDETQTVHLCTVEW